MKQRIAPWMAALVCAIAIHIVIIEVSDSQHWFDITPRPSTFELFLLPGQAESSNAPTETRDITQTNATQAAQTQQPNRSVPEEAVPQETTASEQAVANEPDQSSEEGLPTGKELSEKTTGFDPQDVLDTLDKESVSSNTALDTTDDTKLTSNKPDLLDLSKISLSPDVKEETLTNIFSPELRDKIAQSQKAQKDYLKGLVKEVDYPITKDADGTRYVNIKGVCWRLPKEGSNEAWAIVFDGCGIKSKLFHFELNISPSLITNEVLGPDSPFNLTQPAK